MPESLPSEMLIGWTLFLKKRQLLYINLVLLHIDNSLLLQGILTIPVFIWSTTWISIVTQVGLFYFAIVINVWTDGAVFYKITTTIASNVALANYVVENIFISCCDYLLLLSLLLLSGFTVTSTEGFTLGS